MEVPIHYDPMISKLITYGENRKESIDRMRRAISDYQVVGVSTTLPFGAFVMDHPAFVSGDFDTHFLSKYFTGKSITSASKEEKEVAAWFAAKLINDHSTASMVVNASVESQWRKNRK